MKDDLIKLEKAGFGVILNEGNVTIASRGKYSVLLRPKFQPVVSHTIHASNIIKFIIHGTYCGKTIEEVIIYINSLQKRF